MRETDLNIVMNFITRTGMFIGKVSDDSIISFIHGYEIGTDGKCNLTEPISELLSSQYSITKIATGWPGQIGEYAIKNEFDWITSFRKVVLKHFYLTQDFNVDSEFKTALKSRIESIIDQLNINWVSYNFKDWMNEWNGLTDFSEKTFRSIWNKDELEILAELDNEINKIKNNQTQLTDRLLELRIEYRKITKIQY